MRPPAEAILDLVARVIRDRVEVSTLGRTAVFIQALAVASIRVRVVASIRVLAEECIRVLGEGYIPGLAVECTPGRAAESMRVRRPKMATEGHGARALQAFLAERGCKNTAQISRKRPRFISDLLLQVRTESTPIRERESGHKAQNTFIPCVHRASYWTREAAAVSVNSISAAEQTSRRP